MKTWKTPWGETVKVSLESVKWAAARFLRAASLKEVAVGFDRGYLSPHQREVRLPVWARVLAFALGFSYDPRDRSDIARVFARAKAAGGGAEALEAAAGAFWPLYRKAKKVGRRAEAKAYAMRAEAAYAEALGLEAKWYGLLPPEAAPTRVLWVWRELKRRALARVLRPRPWGGGLLWPRPKLRRLLAEGLAELAREGASALASKPSEARRPDPELLRLLADDLLRRYREGDPDAVVYMAAAGSVLGLPGDSGELAQVAIVGAWKALERWRPGGIPRELWGMVHGRRAAQVFLSRSKGLKKRDAEILRRAMRMGLEEGRALLEAHGLLVEIESLADEGVPPLPDEDHPLPGEVAWRAEVRQRLVEVVGGEGKLELLLQVFVDRRPLGDIAAELGVSEEALSQALQHLVERVKSSTELQGLWLEI